jgi:hypothetical protein
MLERGIKRTFQTSFKLPISTKLIDGQMIFAKVNKLFPEGMAEINYGGKKTIAKLETPLAAGNHYLFQTEVTEEGLLKLRVISAAPSDAKIPNSVLPEKLLNDLNLPKGGTIKELVLLLVKNSLPFTKKELALMSELLSRTPDRQAGMEAILKLKEANIPVSKPLYYSHLHGKSMEPLSNMMQGLETALQKSGHKSMEMKEVLKILSSIKEIETPNLLQKVTVRASDMYMNPNLSDTQRTSALKLLQVLGLLPEESTLDSVRAFPGKEERAIHPLSHFMNRSPSTAQVRDKLMVLLEYMSGIKAPDEKVQALIKDIQFIMKRVELEKGITQELIRPALALLSQGDRLISQTGTVPQMNDLERFNLLFGLHSGKAEEIHSRFSQIMQQLDNSATPGQPALKLLQQLISADEGNAAGIHKENLPVVIKELISKLGINYEAKLAAGTASLNESLKPALIALLQEIPAGEIREYGERLLYKLNGQSILSGDNGPLQHIHYQFPLSWLNQKLDVTMQWSGRKTENGQIDPGFCRILFYLELENIKEVIVDMGVQNKVITLNIYNDTPGLKEMAAPFSSVMKEGLERVGYKVSVLNFKEPDHMDSAKRVYQEMAGEVSYSGVDLKI